MGFGMMLTNTRTLAEKREQGQYPAENDRYPVIWVTNSGIGPRYEHEEFENSDEYWAATRSRDIVSDLLEISEGGFVGWFILVAAVFLIGLWVGSKFL